ncbi:hypothetical protein ACQJ71_03435 [Helicobacter pylori]
MLFQSKEVSKKPFFLKTPLKNNRFNKNRKKAHLVRQFYSLMVFEGAFFKFEKIVAKQTPHKSDYGDKF